MPKGIDTDCLCCTVVLKEQVWKTRFLEEKTMSASTEDMKNISSMDMEAVGNWQKMESLSGGP